MSTMQLEQHKWVKHTITPVSALPDLDDDRQIVVIENDDDIKEAEENAVFGCDRCGVQMEGNTDSLCDPCCHCGTPLSEHTASDHAFTEMR